MPYGLPKDIGGDSPSNNKWMENCVSKVSKTKAKSSAIAICKAQITKDKRKNKNAEFKLADSYIINQFSSFKYSFIKDKMNSGLNFKQANDLFFKSLIKDNYTF